MATPDSHTKAKPHRRASPSATLLARMDAFGNVMLPMLYAGAPGRVRHERAWAALEAVGLADRAHHRPNELSGGQQQRVAIARALVQEPEIILADEPVASLDPHNAIKVMAALCAINREDGITVICNLHTLDMARTFCDRIVGMADGKVVFDGPPAVLTTEGVREIYGVDEAVEGFHEVITPFDTMVPGNREAEPTPAMRRLWLKTYGKERGARCLLDER